VKTQSLLSKSISIFSDNERAAENVVAANVASAVLEAATAAGGGTPLSWGPAGLQVALGLKRTMNALTGHDNDAGLTERQLTEIRGGLIQIALGVAGFVPVVALVNLPAFGVDAFHAGRQYLLERDELKKEERIEH